MFKFHIALNQHVESDIINQRSCVLQDQEANPSQQSTSNILIKKEKNNQPPICAWGNTSHHYKEIKTVENHRIFSRYSLIYFLPFVYIILPFTLYFPSFYTLFCFIFVPFFYIYIGVSILCNTHSLIQ